MPYTFLQCGSDGVDCIGSVCGAGGRMVCWLVAWLVAVDGVGLPLPTTYKVDSLQKDRHSFVDKKE